MDFVLLVNDACSRNQLLHLIDLLLESFTTVSELACASRSMLIALFSVALASSMILLNHSMMSDEALVEDLLNHSDVI